MYIVLCTCRDRCWYDVATIVDMLSDAAVVDGIIVAATIGAAHIHCIATATNSANDNKNNNDDADVGALFFDSDILIGILKFILPNFRALNYSPH